MTQQFFLLFMFNVGFMTYVNGANYSLPGLKDEVTSTWTLSAFASLIRDAILSANPFPWDFVKRTLESDNDFDIMSSTQEVVMIELPLLIPVMLGLVCAVLLPIVSLMFCCCRCCCKNCGGKLTTADIRKQKPIPFFVNVLVVLLMIGILCAMGSSIPPSGDRLKTGPRIIYRVIEASLDDLKLFLDIFVQDASDLAKTTLNTTIETIKTELDNLPDSLANSVTDGALPYVEDIENKIGSISDGIDSLKSAESTLNATVDNIVLLVAALQTGLTNINNRWTILKSQCETDGETFCTLLPVGTGPSSLGITIDTTQLTDTQDTMAEVVTTADAVDLTQYQNLANTTFTEIPGTIRNSSQSAIDGVKVTLDGVPAEIEPVIDTALQATQVDMDFSSILDPLNEYIMMLEEQYSLLHTIFLAVGGVLIVLSLLVFAGCSLGTLCTRSSGTARSGRTKAGHCGANLLMVYVCVAVLPVMISLLVGSVMMLVGANMTIVCQPLQDLSMFEQVVDNGLIFGGESLGKTLMNDESFNVSISYMFKTCRKNETVFKGLNIQSGMDLSSHFDVGEFVPEFGDDLINQVNTTIDGISVVDTSLFNNLTTKLDLPDIDTSSISTIIGDLTNLNLTGTSQAMSDLADSLTHGDYKSAYQAISLDLQNLHDNTTQPLITAVNSVQVSVDGINSSCISLKTIITDLSTSLDSLTSFIGTQAVTVIVQALNDFLAEMLEVPENMINSVLDTLGTDVGHCQVLADIYDTFLGAVCEYSLDSYNTLWAAFYTGGMVAVILMICSCTLNKYFRMPNDLLQTRINQHQNIGYHAHPAGGNHILGGSDIILTRYRNFNVRSEDENNNVVNSSTQNQRINQRWRQRRKFVTGPYSAHLFKSMSANNKVLPEPYKTPRSLSTIPSLSVNQVTHTLNVQGVSNSVNKLTTADNKVEVYDLENDSDNPVCNGNRVDDSNNNANKVDNVRDANKVHGVCDANKVHGVCEVTGIDDDKKEGLDSDSINVSDDNAYKNIPRNENGHNCNTSQSHNNGWQDMELEHYTNPTFQKKVLLNTTKNLSNVDLGFERNSTPTLPKKSLLNLTKNLRNGDLGIERNKTPTLPKKSLLNLTKNLTNIDLGIERNKTPTLPKKSKLNTTKNLTTVTDKPNAGADTGVNIKADHFLFPAPTVSEEKKEPPVQNFVTNLDNETELKPKPKKLDGVVDGDLWLKKYRIKDVDNINVGKSDQFSKHCSNNCTSETKQHTPRLEYSKYLAHHTPTKDEKSEQYSSGKIVCALCKNKIQRNLNDTDSNSNCTYINHRSHKNEGDMFPHHTSHPPSLLPPDIIVDVGENKKDGTTHNTTNHSIYSGNISSTFLNRIPPETLPQVVSKHNKQIRKSKYSTGKLDVKVQAYKCQQRPLSPRGAFLFWQYIDGSYGSVEDHHGMLPHSNTCTHTHADNVTNNSGLEFVNPLPVSKTLSNLKPEVNNNVKESINNSSEPAVQQKTYFSSVDQLGPGVQNNIPDSLQTLSIRAGQQVYCQNSPDDVCYYQTSQASIYDEDCPVVRPLSQPQSLSDLATMAIVNTEKSVFYPKPSRTYGSASTKRANIPLTYC